MNKLINIDFCNKLRHVLESEHIISSENNIDVKISEANQNYYLVNVQNQIFIVKKVREKDYSYYMSQHLQKINEKLGEKHFPITLIPPFIIDEQYYIISTYQNGNALVELMSKLSDCNLQQIEIAINRNLQYIHSITNSTYSEGDINRDFFYELMIEKFNHQLHNKYVIRYLKNINLNKLLTIARDILLNADYSPPTFIHMDINPSNIIVSPSGSANLIDFELSRFGDLDYEWVNLLAKTLHQYDKRYKNISYTR